MKRLLLAGLAAVALMGTSTAMARVDVGISIGVPGVIYTQPEYYHPPVHYVERPRVIVVPERHYRPVRVVEPRHYREYRGSRHHANKHGYKHGKKHHHRGHRH